MKVCPRSHNIVRKFCDRGHKIYFDMNVRLMLVNLFSKMVGENVYQNFINLIFFKYIDLI